MNKGIQWLFFDMGGVILDDSKPEILRQELALKVLKAYLPEVTMADARQAWMHGSKIPGSVRIMALRELCKNLANADQIEEEYKRLYQIDYYTLSTVRPEAKLVLSELSQNYKLGLMANQKAKYIKHLEDAGLLPYFTHLKMSGHIGLEKPDPNFFLSILEDTAAKANESVIIDDNWFRGLVPARKAGMKTVLYKRDIIPAPENADPDWTVTELHQLLELF